MSVYFGEISSARPSHPLEYPDLLLAHNADLREFIVISTENVTLFRYFLDIFNPSISF